MCDANLTTPHEGSAGAPRPETAALDGALQDGRRIAEVSSGLWNGNTGGCGENSESASRGSQSRDNLLAHSVPQGVRFMCIPQPSEQLKAQAVIPNFSPQKMVDWLN